MKNFTAITHAHVWVLDHQEALDFYVGKLELEVKADYTRGGFRWLTVGVPGQAVPEIVLDVPGPPVMDEKTAARRGIVRWLPLARLSRADRWRWAGNAAPGKWLPRSAAWRRTAAEETSERCVGCGLLKAC